MVRIRWPPKSFTSLMQIRLGSSFTRIVQAPHAPMSQAFFAPVRSRFSRRNSTMRFSIALAGTSISFPLTKSFMGGPPLVGQASRLSPSSDNSSVVRKQRTEAVPPKREFESQRQARRLSYRNSFSFAALLARGGFRHRAQLDRQREMPLARRVENCVRNRRRENFVRAPCGERVS